MTAAFLMHDKSVINELKIKTDDTENLCIDRINKFAFYFTFFEKQL